MYFQRWSNSTITVLIILRLSIYLPIYADNTADKSKSTKSAAISSKNKSTKSSKSTKELKKKLVKQYRAKTMKYIVNEQFTELLKYDELNRELSAG